LNVAQRAAALYALRRHIANQPLKARHTHWALIAMALALAVDKQPA
jgi:hypothetical protein